ncbi:Inner membrane ABC transporter permease protein YcjP [Paenibacillus konkukensis]|uniref:Inner membrane ABC transporter permease protein YcjP n=1 Tax=Paenibacillus konkukensis TaxID=2020716 RepID=A0ABY4RLJ4_9BACL|nr:carbohydrate ABC transporter permease [Paenibacillus konkukensis]UQZ82453.1 Inner membrane ABC transporter permease protein YcjP [Paenibacillus konkukensis]
MEQGNIKDSGGDRLFNAANYAVMILILLIVLYPVVFVVSSSFSAKEAVASGKVLLLPIGFSLEGYQAVFRDPAVLRSIAVSIGYTVAGTFINVVLTIMAAYPLSRRDLKGRGWFMGLFAFTMFFNGGLIPTYLLVKDLNLLDTPWALLLPTAVSIWNMVITRTYFNATIPDELLEAAQMDGCNDLLFLWKVVLPLSGPIVAVIALYYGVEHWNQYFNALMYMKNPKLYPLQLVLREILIRSQVTADMMGDSKQMAELAGLSDLLKYSLIVVATAPLMLVYPFVQRYFVRGVMIGALKG